MTALFHLLFLLCAPCVISFSVKTYQDLLFEKFIKIYGKSYLKGSTEYTKRYKNFLASLERIQSKEQHFNIQSSVAYSENETEAVYGINKFSDLSQKEFQDIYLSFIPNVIHSQPHVVLPALQDDFPKKFDWRDNNVVTDVKDQGKCGSCWAFSTVECVESAWAISYKQKVTLSTQEVVDCSTNNYGCQGGNSCSALSWIKNKKVKIVKDSLYPYHESKGKCTNESVSTFGVGVLDYFCYSCSGTCSSVEMKQMIPTLYNYGPIAVSVNAMSWQDYMGGIIQHHCSFDSPDHSVQVVGFDLTGDIPYWIVRNSWGTDFGYDGYLHIKIGDNVCGIANSYSGVTSVSGN